VEEISHAAADGSSNSQSQEKPEIKRSVENQTEVVAMQSVAIQAH